MGKTLSLTIGPPAAASMLLSALQASALIAMPRTPTRQVAHLEAAMFWMGAVYTFCRVHATLRGTPAMAADLTDHVWSVDELRRYRCQRE